MSKIAAVALCVFLAFGGVTPGLGVRFKDAHGDDVGGGMLAYPDHQVYVRGLFDLLQFGVTRDDDYIYFDFQAPEGYFHQRLEVYITTGSDFSEREIKIGSHRFETSSSTGWDVRLSVAPFGESRLYVLGEDSVQVFSEEISSRSLPESQTIRVQVPKDLLPQPNPGWGYYVLVGSFDGLAQDSWRDLGQGPWQVGGEGVPVFDLLAPRFGRQSQQSQLTKGVLYPVYISPLDGVPWLVVATVPILAIGGFFLWRWRHGRP